MCQLNALQYCLNLTTLRKALASLPRTLDETYARILYNIPEEYTEYAIKILQFLAFSTRPLELGELAEVIAINPHGCPWFDRDARLPKPREVLKICPGLIIEERRDKDSDDDSDEDSDEDNNEDNDEDSGEDHDEYRDEDNDADRYEDGDEKWDESNTQGDEDHDEHLDDDRDVISAYNSENRHGYGNDDQDRDDDEIISALSEENNENAEIDKSSSQTEENSSDMTERKDSSEEGESVIEKIKAYDAKYDFKHRNIVRLAHFSVKEYLLSERIRDKTASYYAKEASKFAIQEISAHESIAAHCLAYLLQFEEYGEI